MFKDSMFKGNTIWYKMLMARLLFSGTRLFYIQLQPADHMAYVL